MNTLICLSSRRGGHPSGAWQLFCPCNCPLFETFSVRHSLLDLPNLWNVHKVACPCSLQPEADRPCQAHSSLPSEAPSWGPAHRLNCPLLRDYHPAGAVVYRVALLPMAASPVSATGLRKWSHLAFFWVIRECENPSQGRLRYILLLLLP